MNVVGGPTREGLLKFPGTMVGVKESMLRSVEPDIRKFLENRPDLGALLSGVESVSQIHQIPCRSCD